MNCQAVAEAEKNMVFAASLTQRGHRIATMEDLLALYEKLFSTGTVEAIGGLPILRSRNLRRLRWRLWG